MSRTDTAEAAVDAKGFAATTCAPRWLPWVRLTPFAQRRYGAAMNTAYAHASFVDATAITEQESRQAKLVTVTSEKFRTIFTYGACRFKITQLYWFVEVIGQKKDVL